MNQTYSFFGKNISGPFTIPSGIVTTEPSIIEHIANRIPEIGILTTKSISFEPRIGNREPVYARYAEKPQSFVNAVGLTNPGATEFAKRLSFISMPKNKFLLVSVFGATVDDFFRTAGVLVPFADGFELNISCPHAKGYGQAICQDVELVSAIIKKVKTLGKPVLVKVSPNVDIEKTTQVCLKSGIDGFVAINTWGPKPQEFDKHPILTNVVGGVSGKAIRDIGIQAVKSIRLLTDLPVIACGGIGTARDVLAYKQAGAEYFGIGSFLTNMDTKELAGYFRSLTHDISQGTTTAKRYIKTDTNFIYHKTTIGRIERLDDAHAVITISGQCKVLPGQFVFLWIPGVGEKPFSVLDTHPTKIFIKSKGCFTTEVLKKKQGDTIYWRGPYGKTIVLKGKTLLVGAGTGIAALYLFAKTHTNTFALLGAKTKKEIVYEEAFKKCCTDVWLTLSQDRDAPKQHVTDMLPDVIRKIKPTTILNCGPEQMVYDCLAIEKRFLSQEHIFSSIEFMTKCGVGICGSCATKKGYRNCVDGTFFVPSQLQ